MPSPENGRVLTCFAPSVMVNIAPYFIISMEQHRNFPYCKAENKDILFALWRVSFPKDSSPSFSSFSFFGGNACVLKTFCSGELCTSYSWQLRSHLWSWLKSLVHILFYLCLWSGFLWLFLRLCFYSKDIQPTIFKKEIEVKCSLSIWHCLFRHMSKSDCLSTSVPSSNIPIISAFQLS